MPAGKGTQILLPTGSAGETDEILPETKGCRWVTEQARHTPTHLKEILRTPANPSIKSKNPKPHNPKKRDCLLFPGTDATNANAGPRIIDEARDIAGGRAES